MKSKIFFIITFLIWGYNNYGLITIYTLELEPINSFGTGYITGKIMITIITSILNIYFLRKIF